MQRSTLVLALLLVPGIASAYEWTDVEVIDGPVESISASQGNPVVSDGDRWYVTYVKDGDVWIRVRDGGAWQAPMQMEDDASEATSAQLGNAEDLVVLAWVDDRTGHDEIYTRTLEDGSWTDEGCRTCDGVPSRAPAMSHGQGSPIWYPEEVHLVWEEGATGSAVIQRAARGPAGWSSAVPVSTVPGATTPTVSEMFGQPVVAWIDAGPGALVFRRGEAAAVTIPAPTGQVLMNPSAHYEYCCSDFVTGETLILVEAVDGSEHLTYEVTVGDDPGDPDLDFVGTGGVGVSLDGFQFEGIGGCGDFGGQAPEFVHVHSELSGGTYTTYFSGIQQDPYYFELTDAALTPASIGGREGKPDAELLAIWVEDVEGTPTLVGRRGTEIGGYSYELEDPPNHILVGPAGMPTNDFRLIDGYTGDPWTWPEDVGVQLSTQMVEALTLEDPDDPGYVAYTVDGVDGDGRFSVGIPGGGCTEEGGAIFTCGYFAQEPVFDGAKSPDVDGDCIVTDGDLAYVEAQLGTGDYCADLDGSGVVDATDVGIVTSTLGDACAFVGVADGAVVPKPMFRVDRNPFRTRTTLRLALPEGAERVEVYDVTGRRVRVLAGALEVGGHAVAFDGRDDAGHALSAGTYFVTVVTPSRTMHERLTLLR